MELIRYEGKWYKIIPKPYEPERQTYEIAWMLVKNYKISREDAYRVWYKKEQETAKVLYPSFRKDGESS